MIQLHTWLCKYILDFSIRDTCITIMECSEIERRTIHVEEDCPITNTFKCKPTLGNIQKQTYPANKRCSTQNCQSKG